LAKIYKWVDEKGKTHFTDNPRKVPSQYRTTDKDIQANEEKE
jgi:hypothetical protein